MVICVRFSLCILQCNRSIGGGGGRICKYTHTHVSPCSNYYINLITAITRKPLVRLLILLYNILAVYKYIFLYLDVFLIIIIKKSRSYINLKVFAVV